MRLSIAALTITLTLGLGKPASAAEFTSAYTDLDLEQCTLVSADDFGASRICDGYADIPVYVGESDLRFSISYGLGAGGEAVDGQGLGPFNTLGPRIEWRLSNASGRLRPVATIVRYFTAPADSVGKDNQVLVVTKFEAGAACHIAYVDALANPDANALARQAADASGGFDCATDEVEFVGEFKAWDRS